MFYTKIGGYLSANGDELKHNGYVLCKGKRLKDLKLQFAPVINVGSKTTQLGVCHQCMAHPIILYQDFSSSKPPILSRLAQQIVDLLADIVDASGDMGSKRKKNTDELLHHRRIAIHLHG